MVLKRIISCLAIISVVLIVSCYDVAYDKDDGAAATGNWWDGLSTKQIVEGMEITASEPVSKASKDTNPTTNLNQEIEVSWVCPIEFLGWSVKYKIIGLADGDNTQGDDGWVTLDEDISIVKLEIEKDTFKYKFKHCPFFSTTQYIVYYKIIMKEHNAAEPYENIVSFVVRPESRTLRISLSPETENGVPSQLFGHWISNCLFNIVHPIKISDYVSQDITVSPCTHVFFWIDSDFRSKFGKTVRHYSNSSYCKVEKLSEPNSIPGKIVEATLKYNFEDLPIDKLKEEPSGYFDYDDIVFTVDVIKEVN